MQTRSKLLDDLAQLMTNAAGVAQGVREEAQTALRSGFERFVAQADLVTREEFEAVRDMAQKAREENATLSARLAERDGQIAALGERLSELEGRLSEPEPKRPGRKSRDTEG